MLGCDSLALLNHQCLVTFLRRLCHSSLKTGEDVSTKLALRVQAGHSHSGMDNIAMVGVSKENVPPCRIGSLKCGINMIKRHIISLSVGLFLI